MHPHGTIAGRFRLLERVGEGGMGQVFRAEDLETGRSVAIKRMAAVDETLTERFRREAQTLAARCHPAQYHADRRADRHPRLHGAGDLAGHARHPAGFDDLVTALLQSDRERRTSSAAELVARLDAIEPSIASSRDLMRVGRTWRGSGRGFDAGGSNLGRVGLEIG